MRFIDGFILGFLFTIGWVTVWVAMSGQHASYLQNDIIITLLAASFIGGLVGTATLLTNNK